MITLNTLITAVLVCAVLSFVSINVTYAVNDAIECAVKMAVVPGSEG